MCAHVHVCVLVYLYAYLDICACAHVSVHLHLCECQREAVSSELHMMGVNGVCVCVYKWVQVCLGVRVGISFPLPGNDPLAYKLHGVYLQLITRNIEGNID